MLLDNIVTFYSIIDNHFLPSSLQISPRFLILHDFSPRRRRETQANAAGSNGNIRWKNSRGSGACCWLVYLYFAVRSGSLAVRSRSQITESNSFLRRRMHASKKHPQIFILAVHYRDDDALSDDSLWKTLPSVARSFSLSITGLFIVCINRPNRFTFVPEYIKKNVFSFPFLNLLLHRLLLNKRTKRK